MGKKSGKGEFAGPEDVGADVATERMSIPPVPDDDKFDRENAEAAQLAAEAAPPVDDMLARLTAAMEVIAGQSNRTDSQDRAFDRLAAAFDRMAGAQLEGADRVARATRIANRPSNEVPPGISVFNLRGDKDFPKPTLKCRFLLPWEVEKDGSSCTREEVELLNLLIPGEYAIRRNDDTRVKLTVRATYKLDSDVIDTILVNHDTAFNNDYHALMPPMSNFLRQMLKQNPKTKAAADHVLSMEEEEALILVGKLNDCSVPENRSVVFVAGVY